MVFEYESQLGFVLRYLYLYGPIHKIAHAIYPRSSFVMSHVWVECQLELTSRIKGNFLFSAWVTKLAIRDQSHLVRLMKHLFFDLLC